MRGRRPQEERGEDEDDGGGMRKGGRCGVRCGDYEDNGRRRRHSGMDTTVEVRFGEFDLPGAQDVAQEMERN